MISPAFNPARGIEAFDDIHAELCAKFGGRCWTMQNDVAGTGGVRELTGQSPGTASATGVTLNAPGPALYGEPGRAAAFDGVAGFVTVPTPDLLTAFSISCWVNFTASTGSTVYSASTNNSSRLGLQANSGTLRFGYFNGTAYVSKSSAPLTNGVWYHILGSKGPADTNISLWVNGVPQTGTSNPIGSSGVPQAYFGKTTTNSRFMNGSLAFAAIFQAALDQSHVTTLYREGAQL